MRARTSSVGRWVRRARCARAAVLALGVLLQAAVPAASRAQETRPAAPTVPPIGATAAVAPALRFGVSADTILLPPTERLPIQVRPGRWSRVVASLASVAAADSIVWRSDTLGGDAAGRLGWDLRGDDGRPIPAGRYRLRVTAFDSGGAPASQERILDVERLAADTVPVPAPPRARELLPETVQVSQTTPWAIFIGAAAGLLPGMLGRGELNDHLRSDPKAWFVAVSVTAAGFVAFFAGHRPAFSAANATRNAQLRDDYLLRLAAARAANARAREAAGFRIRAEALAP